MNIIRNEKLIKRNSLIARITMFGGLIVLAGGLFISFGRADLFWLSTVALVVGFILSQIGIYYANRWGRSPRPDQLLDLSLKGLDGKFTLYHYETPANHLLVGPSGIWVLLPRPQKGYIGFSNGRWHHRGGSIYLKLFAQEGLGRPELEVKDEIRRVQEYLAKSLEGVSLPDVRAALVFTNPTVEIDIPEDETPPAETIQAGKLKELVRKNAKEKALNSTVTQQINALFQSESA
jgi:hypothetical protein